MQDDVIDMDEILKDDKIRKLFKKNDEINKIDSSEPEDSVDEGDTIVDLP